MTADRIIDIVSEELHSFESMLKDNPNNSIAKDRVDYYKSILRIMEENKRLKKRIKSLEVEESASDN